MQGLTLKDVLHRVVHESRLTPRQIAEEIGVSYSMLCNAANPDLPEFKFAARHIIPITRATGDFRLIDYLEASVGRVAFSLPELSSELANVQKLISETVHLFGVALGDVGDALKDNRIDRVEIKRIERGLHDQVRTAMRLLEVLKAKAEEGAAV